MNIKTEVWTGNKSEFAAITTGMFDGVHLGHLKVLHRLRETAEKTGLCSTVITFWPHPKHYFAPETNEPLLLTDEHERADLIKAAGIDRLITIEFNREAAEMSSKDYLEQILVQQLKAKKLVIGYDHRFGKGREGNFDYLSRYAANYGFEVEEIPAGECDDLAISSSRIRNALLENTPQVAAQLLGRNYSLSGTVVQGMRRGRQLGYPTANIQPHYALKLLPAKGVYAAKVNCQYGTFGAMMNIGFNPTFGLAGQKTVEVHIFDFNENLYGQSLTVELVAYLRPEQKFPSLEALIGQLHQDKAAALQLL